MKDWRKSYLLTSFLVLGTSVICRLLLPQLGYRAMGSVFLLTILALSSLTTLGPVLFSAIAFSLVWNYFFIPPTFTFNITSWDDVMMVVSFFIAALIGGALSSRLRSRESQLQNRKQKALLYQASEVLHQTLLNSVSHELRTPITAIIGSATALKDPYTLADERARTALTDELLNSAQRLDRVVENLLDLSRLQKGTLQLKKEWFEPTDLFTSAKNSLSKELASKNLNVVSYEPLLIEADFQLLTHSLIQLILNAAKYAKNSPNIDCEIIKSEDYIHICVSDEGPGIPIGMESQVFDKFFRLPGTPAGGLGLGLAIVSSVAELHGGRAVAGHREGRSGAVFKIILPYVPAPAALQEAIR